MWRCPAAPKVCVFGWRIATNSLATMENKHKRTLEKSYVCGLCGVEQEDTFHTICRCPVACALWKAMRESWLLPDLATVVNTGKEWLLHLLDNCTELQRLVILMTFWRVWHCRNEVTHYKPAPAIECPWRFLCSYIESLPCIKQHP